MKLPPLSRAPHARAPRRPGYGWAAFAWLILLAPLITWGIPSTTNERLLFGGRAADWSQVAALARAKASALGQRTAGADTDPDPLAERTGLTLLNGTPEAEAEILIRYRLYSRQPDEMITLRALQQMRPGDLDFDPQLYQYGGAFIYSVAAASVAASLVGLTKITSDVAVYLQNPQYFAAFYVAGRAISLVCGGFALVAIAEIARRIAGARAAGWFALICAAVSPAMITMALESKPHLPATCMILWATLAAMDYARRPRGKEALRLGWRSGLAFGLVLTGAAAAALWPALALARITARQVRSRGLWRHLALAGALAVAVYTVTNPYVVFNALFRQERLSSNLSNSSAMYSGQHAHALSGFLRTCELLAEAGGLMTAILGGAAIVLLAMLRRRGLAIAAAPPLAMLVLAVLLAAGKPAEFGRFLLLPVGLLCVSLGAGLGLVWRARPLAAIAVLLMVIATSKADAYFRAFLEDARGVRESRRLAAEYLAENLPASASLALIQEPAPYAAPPLDFSRVQFWLLPASPPDRLPPELPPFLVFTADNADSHANAWWRAHYAPHATFGNPSRAAEITWANKPVFIFALKRGSP